jgi:hypothetical protein
MKKHRWIPLFQTKDSWWMIVDQAPVFRKTSVQVYGLVLGHCLVQIPCKLKLSSDWRMSLTAESIGSVLTLLNDAAVPAQIASGVSASTCASKGAFWAFFLFLRYDSGISFLSDICFGSQT